MTKEALNRKRSIFSGPLEKELRKTREVLYMMQRLGYYDGTSKNEWKLLICDMEKMERVKWTK